MQTKKQNKNNNNNKTTNEANERKEESITKCIYIAACTSFLLNELMIVVVFVYNTQMHPYQRMGNEIVILK